jgi:asparagine synthase (glutamine-hydrolysing)
MCGITGIFTLQSQASSTLSKIAQSTEKLFLRGPDCGNVFHDDVTALGHRRLSIIDTSEGASQPMTDDSGRYVIVFNGEIFNYRELSDKYLKDKRSSKGLKTNSDTEVLLYLMIHYGTHCLNWLSGFFAFAFYDKEKKELILCRDRFGKKPLLIYKSEAYIAFASEMKALFEYGIPREIDYTVLHQYLQLNYVPQPQSMLKGVEKLKPGHYMRIRTAGTEMVAYYTLKVDPSKYAEYSYEEAKKELVKRLDASVKERMISDVPLGAFLSGGVDSSVIVALASRYTKQLNTFSIGYKDNPYFDETKYAQLVAKKYNTNHTVFSLTTKDFLEHVTDVLEYIDEPFADSSAIPVYILSKHTRKHVTVALSGDGGDEVFAGYNKHGAEWKIRQRSLMNDIVKMALPVWETLPKSRNRKVTNLFRQLHRFAEGATMSQEERYWRWASYNSSDQVNTLLRPEIKAKVNAEGLAEEKKSILSNLTKGDFNQVLLTDMNLVLLSDMLVKVDMMSMANSLEVRSPFLDYKVVDFAFGLPPSYKIDRTLKKKIVQDAFRSLLPVEIYNRPKHGFEIPLLEWFRNELWPMIDDDLLSEKLIAEQAIFEQQSIDKLKRKLFSGNPEDCTATLWALIVFQFWWKRYIS